MVDRDVVAVDCREELAYLRRDGLAGHTCWLCACTYDLSVRSRCKLVAYLQGNMYASMLVMPTALAALYVVARFGSTAPPCENSVSDSRSYSRNRGLLRSRMLGYSHAE